MRQLYTGYVDSFLLGKPDDIPTNEEPADAAARNTETNHELLYTIDKDVRRTHSDLPFFAIDPEYTAKHTQNRDLSDFDTMADGLFGGMLSTLYMSRHHAALARILLIFARTNTAIQYIQGLNELAAVIYHVFYMETPRTSDDWPFVEHDVFWCFSTLVSHIVDIYSRELFTSKFGLKGHLESMSDLLQQTDAELGDQLKTLAISPEFYAIRWFVLLFSGEFELPEVTRLWDVLLGTLVSIDGGIMKYSKYVAVSILIIMRHSIIDCQFGDVITALQHLPSEWAVVETVISFADVLFARLGARRTR